ncbi:MAG: hypothetical protein H7096_13705 [Flavobacterium sp.]|nr:hypothetical protein [Pedobacter sp.]
MDFSILYLIAGFLVPLIPAYILYKTLPAETSVSGPFEGLKVNLSGAFGGYFLLVLIAFAFSYKLLNDSNARRIEKLNNQNTALIFENTNFKNQYEYWTIEGQVTGNSPERTKLFVDCRSTHFASTGDFSSNIYLRNENNYSIVPTALCFFNTEDGYKVINLNKKTSKDFDKFGIVIDISNKLIRIGKPIVLRKAIMFKDGKP